MFVFLAILCIPSVFASKCCGPYTFSGQMRIIGGTATNGTENLFNYDIQFHYDYNLKMARTEQTIDGKPEIALVDYNQNITYTIHDGSCSKSASYQPAQSPCIPDDAVLIGTQVLGSSNNSLAINTWRVTTPLLEYKITVTNDTCSFVQETFYGVLSPGVSGSTTFLLSDITEGALPNGIFQVPPECRHAMRQHPVALATFGPIYQDDSLCDTKGSVSDHYPVYVIKQNDYNQSTGTPFDTDALKL